MSAVTKLGLQKQVSWTRPRPNSDIHVLLPGVGRNREQGTASALDAEVDPAGPFRTSPRLTAEAATTSPPASNSTSNDPTAPFRTILNHSQNPNFNNSMLSNVNGNSVTNYNYNYYLGPRAFRMLPDGSLRLRVNSSEIPQTTVNQEPVGDAGTPAPDAHDGRSESESPSESSRPTNNSADQSLREDSVPSDSDEFVVHVVIEARLTLPYEIFELKTVIPFFFLIPNLPTSRATSLASAI